MDLDTLLEKAKVDGVTMQLDGNDIIVTAPTRDMLYTWRPLLKAHKPALVQRLSVCPTCGANAWFETLDGGRWCEPCVIADRVPVVAVKIWSDTLDAGLWVVADDLPRDQWPQDTPVYRYAEILALRHSPPHVLQWVHSTKQDLGAVVAVVKAPDQERGEPR